MSFTKNQLHARKGSNENRGSSFLPSGGRNFSVHHLHGLQFCFRRGTVDEKVLQVDYHTPRFFAPGYKAKATDTVLDVGAHIGVFSALAAGRAPQGTVHAIEAASENFDFLVENIRVNNLSNVRTHRLLLSDKIGRAKLHHASDNWGHSAITSLLGTETATSELVSSQTLEYFLADNSITNVDYMKMNVEGAEYDILMKAPPPVLRSIACMLIECHPVDDHRGEELIDWLRTCGFTSEAKWSTSEAAKGWIIARRV